MPASPMVKATLIAACLSATSNLLSQMLAAYTEERAFSFDPAAFLRFVTFTLLTAPPNYKWQQFLEWKFPGYPDDTSKGKAVHDVEKEKAEEGRAGFVEHGKGGDGGGEGDKKAGGKGKLSIKNTFLKWFIDGITVGALVNTALFFVLMGILKAQPVATIAHNVRHETIPLILAGYRVWPLVSIVSFSCVPVDKRIVFINFFGLMWGIYMSLVAARV